ncbi:MAG: EGF domain-containing protein [Polyangiales bacterium]
MKTGIWWLAVLVALGCGSTQKGGKRGSTDSDGAAPDTTTDAGTDAGAPHCSSTSCDANATCDDGSGVIKCTCNTGFDGDGTTCTDVDECMTNNGGCGANATCKNLNGGFSCECDALSAKNGNQQCTDMCDMAKADSSICGAGANARCTITKQGAACTSCNPGFTGDGQSCVDHRADCPSECNGGSSSDPNSICVSGAGKFTCTCADGYDGTPGSCKNIDECATGKASCNKDTSTCLDTEGGFYCTCKDGYSGDGGNCKDIDECKDSKLYDCPKNASCINDVGGSPGYHCGCVSPFTGDDPTSCYCDLSGYWAMRQDLTTCWDERALSGTVFIAPGVIQASVWELHKYSYDGSTLTSEKMGCGEDATPDLQSPVFVETYSAYIPASVYAKVGFAKGRDVPIPNVVPGSMFTTPEEGAVSGIKLDGTAEAAIWPSAGTDVHDPGSGMGLPEWEDTDGDGELGLTLWSRWPTQETLASTAAMRLHYSYLPTHLKMNGSNISPDARAACVSTATRVITKLNIDVETCEKLSGDVVNVKAEGRVRSCLPVQTADWGNEISCDMATWAATAHASTDCDPLPLDTQDQTQTSKATFDLVKIGSLTDTIDCTAVKKALPVIDRGTRATTCPF